MEKIDYNLIWQAMKLQAYPNKESEAIAKKRLDVCVTCPHIKPNQAFKFMDWVMNVIRRIVGQKPIESKITGYKCGACGCNIHTKIRHPQSNCPKGKWPKL